MALNMNGFSVSVAGLGRTVNGPVLASIGVAFATGIVSALLLTWPDATPSPTTTAASRSIDETCLTQTWPYREQKCRDAEAAERRLRDVRIVSSDKSQPPRVVKSAVSQDAPLKAATAGPIQHSDPASSGREQYAATWLMGVERMPAHATVTPPIASLSLASANLPLSPATLEPAQPAAQQAAPSTETVAPLQAELSAPAAAPVVQQAKRVRPASDRPAMQPAPMKNNAAMTLVRTYEFPDGRQVTVRHQIKSGSDRPALEADGVLSYASSRSARVIRDDD